MKTFIKFIQESVELEEANQVKMSALKPGDTVKLNKRFGGKQGTVKEVQPNGATVHVSGTETPVFAHHSNFTKINVQKEEVELGEESNLRITKIYNKFPKKATYAVHSMDRKYFKEFDNEADAKKHLESKKS